MEWTVPGIVGGLAAGIIGFLPMLFAAHMRPASSGTDMLPRMIGCVLVSFLTMSAAILICRKLASQQLLAFGVSMAAALFVCALVFAVKRFVSR